jgi:hypothetical protein
LLRRWKGRRAYHLAMITGDKNGGNGITCNDDAARCAQQSNRGLRREEERGKVKVAAFLSTMTQALIC